MGENLLFEQFLLDAEAALMERLWADAFKRLGLKT